jgi:hypothetical protein
MAPKRGNIRRCPARSAQRSIDIAGGKCGGNQQCDKQAPNCRSRRVHTSSQADQGRPYEADCDAAQAKATGCLAPEQGRQRSATTRATTVPKPFIEYLESSRIKLVFLPPYAPNLNLIERL